MKKTLLKLLCMMCLVSCDRANSQSTNEEAISSSNTEFVSNELVCKLTGPEFRERLDKLKTIVFARVKSYQETQDGYSFHFKENEDFYPTLTDFMLSERKCCPFFDFELAIASKNAGATLTVSGPDGAKEMIEMMIEK